MRIFLGHKRGSRKACPLLATSSNALLSRSKARSRATSEDGSLLLEVVISAFIVALIVVGTFSAFDVSGGITAGQRAQAEATALAQQDEERLRGLAPSALANLDETRQVTVQNTTYTIISKSQFISDTAGTPSCNSAGTSADYYDTTSEVTWPYLKNRPPVIETGLVAPPAGGELSVLVEDGRGSKVSGMNITGTGPGSFSGVTGSNGCLIFGPLEEGTYTVTASQAGFVGRNGESEPPSNERSVSVTGQSTSDKTFMFNKAGQIDATLETSPSSLGPAQAIDVVAAQTGLTNATGFRHLLAAESGYSVSSISSPTTFFPFASPYAAYAGTCEANEPEKYSLEANESANGLVHKSTEAQVEPGAVSTVKVVEPGMIVLLYEGNSTTPKNLVSSPEIWIEDTNSGTECNTTAYKVKTIASPTTAKGDLEAPGLPYGTYTVCAYFNKGSQKYRAVVTGQENRNLYAGKVVKMYEGGSGSEVKSGWSCP